MVLRWTKCIMSRKELIEIEKLKIREAFASFELKEGASLIAVGDLGPVVRSLGYNVTEQQVSQLLEVR